MQESRQMAHPSLTKAFLQPATTATMCCQAEWCTHPLPPVTPFLLAQNLSSKWIVPTDNMWPKSDNAKRHHRLLKGGGIFYVQRKSTLFDEVQNGLGHHRNHSHIKKLGCNNLGTTLLACYNLVVRLCIGCEQIVE